MKRPAANTPDRPAYPNYRERFGEDPARFIYANEPLLRARINGLRDPALIRAYLDVETDRDQPREDVVAALNARLQAERQPVATDGGEANGG